MSCMTTSRMLVIIAGLFLILSAPLQGIAEEKTSDKPKKSGLQQRIDFGSSYILGQSIKSGAIYLMHRKQSDIKGMLEVRQDYREEIMEDFGLEKTAIVKEQADQEERDEGAAH